MTQRILFRVVLHGFVLVFLSAFAFFVLDRVVIHSHLSRNRDRFSLSAIRTACAVTEMSGPRTSLRDFSFPVAIYNRDGVLVASNMRRVPHVNDYHRVRLMMRHSDRFASGRFVATRCISSRNTGRYGVVALPPAHMPPERLLMFLGTMVVVLMLASIPLARSVAKPIERLVEATQALGKGDLSVRSEIQRNDEIGTLANAFDEMAHRIESLILSERELLANISHELRTPLARIRVLLETLQEDPAKAPRYIPEISTDLSELEQLIESVFTTARLDLKAGDPEVQLPLKLETVSLNHLLEQALSRFQTRHCGFEVNVDNQAPGLTLTADAALLRRVIDNVLDNAAKYSDQKRVISMMVQLEAGNVRITIADQGIGIAEEDLGNVFKPFFRSDRSRSRQSGGVGLGLALAKRVIEAHHGTIALTSKVGQGTNVTILLPTLHKR